jgi:hypothetical protein
MDYQLCRNGESTVIYLGQYQHQKGDVANYLVTARNVPKIVSDGGIDKYTISMVENLELHLMNE